jgi:hypothetical protein
LIEELQAEITETKLVLSIWNQVTDESVPRKSKFLGKDNNPTPEKYKQIIGQIFDINSFDDLYFAREETVMQIRASLYALGADGVGNINDEEKYVRGLIAAKAFPEDVPEIQEALKEESPQSLKQKRVAEFQQSWTASAVKKGSLSGAKRTSESVSTDTIGNLVNDGMATPQAKKQRLVATAATAAAEMPSDVGDDSTSDNNADDEGN